MMNPLYFGAKHTVTVSADDVLGVRQKLDENPTQFIRREAKDDWIFKGGSIQQLMGVDDLGLGSFVDDVEAMAKVQIKDSTLTVETDHPDTAPLKEEAVVLDGVLKTLLPKDLLAKVTEQWQKTALKMQNNFYVSGVPAGLPDDLKADPNKMIGDLHALQYSIKNSDLDLAFLLLKHPKIEPHLKNTSGYAPLGDWYPSTEKKRTVLKAIMDHPKTTLSELTCPNPKGNTPLSLARSYGTPEYIAHLRNRIRELGGTVE